MLLSAERRGAGRPLLLVHGLGGSHRSWDLVVDRLGLERELHLVDLPGFGRSHLAPGGSSVAVMADAVSAYLADNGLSRIDAVGSSMGATVVLELARRGQLGAVVALAPAGYWTPAQRRVFAVSLRASLALVRALRPIVGSLTANAVTRTLLMAQFSARPWKLDPALARRELESFADAPGTRPALDALLALAPIETGTREGARPVTIGWGRQDRVAFPSQAAAAQRAIPAADLVWFERCGHFPHWDRPEETARLILERCDDPSRVDG